MANNVRHKFVLRWVGENFVSKLVKVYEFVLDMDRMFVLFCWQVEEVPHGRGVWWQASQFRAQT